MSHGYSPRTASPSRRSGLQVPFQNAGQAENQRLEGAGAGLARSFAWRLCFERLRGVQLPSL